MKEKTALVCPMADCGKKVSKEPTNSWEVNETKYYYLVCESCGWTSPSPWSKSAISHAERAGDKLEGINDKG